MSFSKLLISGCLLLSCLGISPRTAQAQEQVTMGVLQRPKAHFSGALRTISADELQKAGSRSILTAIRNIDPSFVVAEDNNAGSDPNHLPVINMWGKFSLLSEDSGFQPLYILDGMEMSLEQLYDMDVHRVERVTLLKDAVATALYGVRASNGVVVITSKHPQKKGFLMAYRGGVHVEAADRSSYDLMNAREALQYDREHGRYSGDNSVASPSYEAVAAAVANGLDTDWLKFPLRAGVGHRHHITAEGGGDAVIFALSLAYNKTAGVMKGSNRERFGGTLLLSYTTEKFDLRNSFTFSKVKRNHSPYGVLSEYMGLPPYLTPYDENGDIVRELWRNDNMTQPVLYNPLYKTALPGKNEGNYTFWQNNLSATWKLNSSLSLLTRLGISKEKNAWERYTFPLSDWNVPVQERGFYVESSDKPFTYDGDVVLSLSELKNEHHQWLVEAGVSAYRTKSEYREKATAGFSPDGFTNYFGDDRTYWRLGLFAAANYTYDRRYTVDFLIKWEKFSSFVDSDSSEPSGAVGLGWNLKNESFLLNNDVISAFCLRASYGVGAYSYLFNKNRFNHNSRINDAIKTRQSNIGMNLSFFNGITFTADLYQKRKKDFFVEFSLPLGDFSSHFKNEYVNTGYELALNAVLIGKDRSNWQWQAGARLNHDKEKVEGYTGNGSGGTLEGQFYPLYRGNLHSGLSYKGFMLTAYFGYYFGGEAIKNTLVGIMSEQWDPLGYRTDGDPATARVVEKDRFFNLQSLHLQYQLPVKDLGIKSLVLSGNAEDLFYCSSIDWKRGIHYPFSRKFSISIAATF